MCRVVAALVCAVLVAGCGNDARGDLSVVLSHGNNSRPYMPWPQDVARQVAGALERAGFRVEIREEEWSEFLTSTKRGEHQLALLGWSADVPDADNFLYVLLDKDNARVGSAQNISFYRSEPVHELLVRARQITDPAERERLYHQAQEIVFQDCPLVPLAFTQKMHAHHERFGRIPVEPVTHAILHRVERPRDHVLLWLRGNDSVRLDPADATDGESSKVIEQIFDTLLRYQPESTEVEPALAVSWEASEDRRLFTFRLRENVQFHDGTPLDAQAVVMAFERQRDPEHPFHFPEADFAYWKDLFRFVERVEVGAGPQEVVFRLSEPAPPFFLKMLAIFSTGIPSPTALKRLGSEFRRHPVGSGPFRFVRWETDVEIALERNPSYWDGAPALAGVRFLVSQDPTVRSQRLLAGERADLIDNLDPQTLASLRSAGDLVVVQRPGLNVAYLAMNTLKPPFDDPRVRQAVAFALDKERIVSLAYRGAAQTATTVVPPSIAGHHAGLASRAQDLDRARALLHEAGLLP